MYDCTIWGSFECYLNFPEPETPEEIPLSYAYIREQQQEDNKLLALLEKYPDNYYYDKLDDDVEDIICYHKIITMPIGKLHCQTIWFQK